jgi:hypothetical protein
MKTTSYNESVLFEHRFWLQILGDHSRFIFNALSSKQSDEIKQAEHFIVLFDNLLNKAREMSTQEDIRDITSLAYDASMAIRKFKLHILRTQLIGKIKISLPPTFLNHMLNELDEYIQILEMILKNQYMKEHPLHYHLLWLVDASGHAASIMNNLDMTEKRLIKISKEYSKAFDDLNLKATDFKGYIRTGLVNFPALERLNSEVELQMDSFMKYLLEIKDGVAKKTILGTLSSLEPDHMYREECYYLTKLSRVSNIMPPHCNPDAPRAGE